MKALLKIFCIPIVLLALILDVGGWSGDLYAQPSNRNLDIYLLIGQSNMGGRGDIPEADAGEVPGVWLLRGEDDWVEAKNPYNVYSTIQGGSINKMNPGYTFSIKMRELLPDRQIGIVSNARGATGLSSWLPGTERYNEAVKRARQAMEYGTIRGILWHQGEEDTKNPDNIPLYLDRIETMITALREDLGNPTLPFIAGQISQEVGSYEAFNEMILDFPGILPNTDLVLSEGVTTKAPRDRVHFNTEGQKLLGRRYADKMYPFVSGVRGAPSVSFSRPAANASLDIGDDIYVAVNASDANGSISQVDLYLNGTLLRRENSEPYEWNAEGQNDPALVNLAEGNYTLRAVAIDNDGLTSEVSLTFTIGSPCSIVPFVNVNGDGWNEVAEASLDGGGSVSFGPQSEEFGADQSDGWSWTGPNGFASAEREIVLDNVGAADAGTYRVTNTDTDGCKATLDFGLRVTGTGQPATEGVYYLKNVATGQYLDSDPNGVVLLSRPRQGADTRWNLVTSTEGFFFIDSSIDDRGPLAAFPALGSPIIYKEESFNDRPFENREWQAVPLGNNTFAFLCKDNARGYITAIGDSAENRADGNDDAAHWELVPANTTASLKANIAGPTAHFAMHPNPTRGGFTVDTGNTAIKSVAIFSMAGQKVHEENFKEAASKIQINETLVPGVYLVRFKSDGDHTVTKKIVVE